MKIKSIITCYHSKRDIYGNSYCAMQYVDCATGKQVFGTISGGESNIRGVIIKMGLKFDEYYFSKVEMPIRRYNTHVKDWLYAGCAPEELAAFINKNLK